MFKYKLVEKNIYEVDINDKKVKVTKDYVDNCINNLDLNESQAIEMFLEDEVYINNEEQIELTQKAKEHRVKMKAKKEDKAKLQKTQKERVHKDNPTKEEIIGVLAKALETLDIKNLVIENKGKLITFEYKNENFKVDLVQKRKKKAEE